jgi:hypothetical protein
MMLSQEPPTGGTISAMCLKGVEGSQEEIREKIVKERRKENLREKNEERDVKREKQKGVFGKNRKLQIIYS